MDIDDSGFKAGVTNIDKQLAESARQMEKVMDNTAKKQVETTKAASNFGSVVKDVLDTAKEGITGALSKPIEKVKDTFDKIKDKVKDVGAAISSAAKETAKTEGNVNGIKEKADNSIGSKNGGIAGSMADIVNKIRNAGQAINSAGTKAGQSANVVNNYNKTSSKSGSDVSIVVNGVKEKETAYETYQAAKRAQREMIM